MRKRANVGTSTVGAGKGQEKGWRINVVMKTEEEKDILRKLKVAAANNNVDLRVIVIEALRRAVSDWQHLTLPHNTTLRLDGKSRTVTVVPD